MDATGQAPSARRAELLEAAYRYVLRTGLGELSLRPLAAAIGSSPRVLIYLFGSKDELVRALLARARAAELAMLDTLRQTTERESIGLDVVAEHLWSWLAAEEHRALLTLWTEAYGRSLLDPDGPWSGFAAATVADLLDVLAAAQPAADRDLPTGRALRTLVLATLRGALLDLLATGDVRRTTAAVHRQLALLRDSPLCNRTIDGVPPGLPQSGFSPD
jgi:AcrR family transcriptional regulator